MVLGSFWVMVDSPRPNDGQSTDHSPQTKQIGNNLLTAISTAVDSPRPGGGQFVGYLP